MPNRILREGILTSERVNSLNWEAEVFYRRLMSVVDDFGRFSAHPSLLRAALFPLKLDTVRDANMERLLSLVEQARLVRVYEVAGKRYLELLDFKQQVRAKESKFPPPPPICAADAKQVPSTSTASAHLDGDEDGDVIEDERDSGVAHLAQLPPAFLGDENSGQINPKARVVLASAWELPSAWGIDAESLGWRPDQILRESEKFRQYWVAGKGQGTRRTLKGWRQSWSNWLSNAEKYAA